MFEQQKESLLMGLFTLVSFFVFYFLGKHCGAGWLKKFYRLRSWLKSQLTISSQSNNMIA